MDRSKRPRPCCREAAHLVPIALPPAGAGVREIVAEQCLAPAPDDGLIVVDGTRRCGRRHFLARMAPGQYGATPQPLRLGGA